MELKLMKEGTQYILGLPIKSTLFSQVINYEEVTIECYPSLGEAKRAGDDLAKQLGKSLVIYERILRRLE